MKPLSVRNHFLDQTRIWICANLLQLFVKNSLILNNNFGFPRSSSIPSVGTQSWAKYSALSYFSLWELMDWNAQHRVASDQMSLWAPVTKRNTALFTLYDKSVKEYVSISKNYLLEYQQPYSCTSPWIKVQFKHYCFCSMMWHEERLDQKSTRFIRIVRGLFLRLVFI